MEEDSSSHDSDFLSDESENENADIQKDDDVQMQDEQNENLHQPLKF